MKRRKYQGLALGFAITVLTAQISRAEIQSYPVWLTNSDDYTLKARTISYYGSTDIVCVEGTCQMIAPGARMIASYFLLDLKRQIILLREPQLIVRRQLVLTGSSAAFHLQSGHFVVIDPELNLPHLANLRLSFKGSKAICQNGLCAMDHVFATGCPHTPRGYQVYSESVVRHPSGDIDLLRPSLVVGTNRLATIPWLRLRGPGKTGFGVPKLGWDTKGGLVVGPTGIIPLPGKRTILGHLAVRTKEGFETSTELQTTNATLALEQLFDGHEQTNSLRLRGQGHVALHSAEYAFNVDIPSDSKIVDAFAKQPLDRALTHTSSRALARFDIGHLILEFNPVVYQTLHTFGPSSKETMMHTTTANLSYPHQPLTRHFFVGFDLELFRFGSTVPSRPSQELPGENFPPVAGKTGLSVSYEFSSPFRVGPLHFEARAGAQHSWELPDDADPEIRMRNMHLVALALDLSLPLGRKFQAIAHIIEPFVRTGFTKFEGEQSTICAHMAGQHWTPMRGSFANLSCASQLETHLGVVETGVRTALSAPDSTTILGIQLYERLNIVRNGTDSPGPLYSVMSVETGFQLTTFELQLAWDHRQKQPSSLGVSLTSQSRSGHLIKLGGRRVGPGRGPHQDVSLNQPVLPTAQPAWLGLPDNLAEVTEESSFPLLRRISIFQGVRLGIAPFRAITAVWYGFRFSSTCGCLQLSVIASHRYGNPIPDAMATLTLLNLPN